MTEKFEIERTVLLKGTCTFSLNFIGISEDGYRTNYILKIKSSERSFETSSDIYTGKTLYDALLRAYISGKSALQKNKWDGDIADQAFGLYVEKKQLKLPFKGLELI